MHVQMPLTAGTARVHLAPEYPADYDLPADARCGGVPVGADSSLEHNDYDETFAGGSASIPSAERRLSDRTFNLHGCRTASTS